MSYMANMLQLRAHLLPNYLPWGSVGEVVPYLLRRATENADAMSGAPAQRAMMLRELGRRIFWAPLGRGGD